MPVDPLVIVLLVAALCLGMMIATWYARRPRRRNKLLTVRVIDKGWDALTPREREIVRLVAGGKSNTEIAKKLVISDRTVANHIRHIYEKLDVHNRVELTQVMNEHTR
jgi:DNA-binding NarL/FixJ family response regulator